MSTSERSGGGVAIRSARRGEERLLAEIGWRAFRFADVEYWNDYYGGHPHLAVEKMVVAEVDGAMAGHAAPLALTMSLAGTDVPFVGVAAVSVAPEFRRRGIAARLMEELLRRAHAERHALSLLFPFRQSFYARFGYALCESRDHLRVAPAQLPESTLRERVRPLDHARDTEAVRAVYEATRGGTTGQLVRGDWWWERRVLRRAPEGAVYRDPAGRVTGYLLHEPPAEPGPACLVHELRACTPDARRGLLGFLEALRDQYAVIELALPAGEGRLLLVDDGAHDLPAPLRSAHVSGFLACGAMGRIVDLGAALAAHPSPAARGLRGRVGLDLSDPVIPEQSGRFDLAFDSGGARLEPGGATADRLALDVGHLTQIYLGAASARALRTQGFVDGSERAAALLDEAFTGPPPFLGRLNYF